MSNAWILGIVRKTAAILGVRIIAKAQIHRARAKFWGSGRVTAIHVSHLSRKKHEIPRRAQESAHFV